MKAIITFSLYYTYVYLTDSVEKSRCDIIRVAQFK